MEMMKPMQEMVSKYLKLSSLWYDPTRDLHLYIKEASLISKGFRNLVEHMLGHCADKEMNPTYREMALVWCATAVRL
jgi:hypothetical protein